MEQHWCRSPTAREPVRQDGVLADGRRALTRRGTQNRVRMPIVPTIWFAVLEAPPDVLMKAW